MLDFLLVLTVSEVLELADPELRVLRRGRWSRLGPWRIWMSEGSTQADS